MSLEDFNKKMRANDKGVEVNNKADVLITCGHCGSMFMGEARYTYQLSEAFATHYRWHEMQAQEEATRKWPKTPKELLDDKI